MQELRLREAGLQYSGNSQGKRCRGPKPRRGQIGYKNANEGRIDRNG